MDSQDMSHRAGNGRLTTKQDLALSALLEASSVAEAAQASGLGVRTLYRWLAENKAFKEAYLSARRESMGHVIGRLQRAAGKAVATLEGVMDDAGQPASSRVVAARTVLEMALRGLELEDLEMRISALEGRVDNGGR